MRPGAGVVLVVVVRATGCSSSHIVKGGLLVVEGGDQLFRVLVRGDRAGEHRACTLLPLVRNKSLSGVSRVRIVAGRGVIADGLRVVQRRPPERVRRLDQVVHSESGRDALDGGTREVPAHERSAGGLVCTESCHRCETVAPAIAQASQLEPFWGPA